MKRQKRRDPHELEEIVSVESWSTEWAYERSLDCSDDVMTRTRRESSTECNESAVL